MRGETSSESGSGIVVSAEVLKSTNISLEQLQQYLIELKRIFGKRFDTIIPKRIDGVPALYWVVSLSQRLQKLEQCEGFDKHIKTYMGRQPQSSYFVTVIASYLLDRVDNIALEPAVTGRTTKSDILVNFRGEQVYLECKQPNTLKFDYSREHEHMFSILRDYINVPHQISIKYRKSLSDAELHRLGETLQQRAGLPTGDGIIINNPDLEVQVIKREAYANKRLCFIMSMVVEDQYENCRYPGHAYTMGGITLTLSGPKVDYSKVLREKLKKSKGQSPQDQPYILMIDGNSMLGDLTENIRALSTAFQPETNTRFSAAVLVEYYPRLDSPELNFDFHVVSNPFAEFPVGREFERLFRTSLK